MQKKNIFLFAASQLLNEHDEHRFVNEIKYLKKKKKIGVIHTFEFIIDMLCLPLTSCKPLFFTSPLLTWKRSPKKKAKTRKKRRRRKNADCVYTMGKGKIVRCAMASVKEKIALEMKKRKKFVSNPNYINTRSHCRQFISFSKHIE